MLAAHSITQTEYSGLQSAYDHFNTALFDAALPGALITLQRKNGTYGYFCRANFVSRNSDDKQSADEIALNPDVFARVDDTEIMQTLVHEMAHQWQFHFGSPSRRTYHNLEWAAKMESIGLMPSSTGKPGGKKVGQYMADYAIAGGRFEASWNELQHGGFKIGWESRDTSLPFSIVVASPADDSETSDPQPSVVIEIAPAKPRPKSKVKFTCPECGINVWGKPGLKLICGSCYETSGTLKHLCEIEGSGA